MIAVILRKVSFSVSVLGQKTVPLILIISEIQPIHIGPIDHYQISAGSMRKDLIADPNVAPAALGVAAIVHAEMLGYQCGPRQQAGPLVSAIG